MSESIITAVAALSGVGIAQFFGLLQASKAQHYKLQVLQLERLDARHNFLLVKLEGLLACLDDSVAWALLATTNLTSFHATAPVDARKVYGICLLYFPLILPEAGVYLTACLALQNSVKEDNKTQQLTLDAAFSSALNTYGQARNALDKKIQQCAMDYLKA